MYLVLYYFKQEGRTGPACVWLRCETRTGIAHLYNTIQYNENLLHAQLCPGNDAKLIRWFLGMALNASVVVQGMTDKLQRFVLFFALTGASIPDFRVINLGTRAAGHSVYIYFYISSV